MRFAENIDIKNSNWKPFALSAAGLTLAGIVFGIGIYSCNKDESDTTNQLPKTSENQKYEDESEHTPVRSIGLEELAKISTQQKNNYFLLDNNDKSTSDTYLIVDFPSSNSLERQYTTMQGLENYVNGNTDTPLKTYSSLDPTSMPVSYRFEVSEVAEYFNQKKDLFNNEEIKFRDELEERGIIKKTQNGYVANPDVNSIITLSANQDQMKTEGVEIKAITPDFREELTEQQVKEIYKK